MKIKFLFVFFFLKVKTLKNSLSTLSSVNNNNLTIVDTYFVETNGTSGKYSGFLLGNLKTNNHFLFSF